MPQFLYSNAIYNIEDDAPVTYFRGIDTDNHRFAIRTTDFEPCFFAKDSDIDKAALLNTGKVTYVEKYTRVPKSIIGHPVSLIKTHVPTDVSDRWSRTPSGIVNVHLNDAQTFQSDIRFEQNVMIWNNIFSGIKVPRPNLLVHNIPSYKIGAIVPYDEFALNPILQYIDIETWWFPDDKKSDIENATKPIIAVTTKVDHAQPFKTHLFHPEKEPQQDCIDDVLTGVTNLQYPWEIYFHQREKSLLEATLNDIIRGDPDIITGWNVNFDLKYIIDRCKKNAVDVSILSPYADFMDKAVGIERGDVIIKGRTIMDERDTYMNHTMFDGMLRSYRLESVLQHEFKAGKVKYSGTTGQLMQRSPDILARYNAVDVEACQLLNRTKELFPYKEYVRRQLGVQIHYANSMSVALHALFVRRSMAKGMAFLNRNYDTKHYQGAHVFDATVGLFDAAIDMDFKTLYPYIIINFNLSPETIIDDPENYSKEYLAKCIRTPNGLIIHPPSVKKGFIPEICEEFIALRDEAKAKALRYREQYGKNDPRTKGAEQAQKYEKSKTNSIYGLMPMYDLRIAEAITAIERELIQYTAARAKSPELKQALKGAGFI